MATIETIRYETAGGFVVERSTEQLPIDGVIEPLVDALNSHRGVLLTSNYEYPGRYTRWDMGFVDPPVVMTAKGRTVVVDALDERGVVIVNALASIAASRPDGFVGDITNTGEGTFTIEVPAIVDGFTEEERSRQPSVFSVMRWIISVFASKEDTHLGLYGAMGYDLTFQFDPIEFHLRRDNEQRDLVLYLPDEILVVDRQKEEAIRFCYDFALHGAATSSVERKTHVAVAPVLDPDAAPAGDHQPGEFEAIVEAALESFRRGDLFEVVPGQVFSEPMTVGPSEVFRRLRSRNPSPYGAFINLGDQEYLIAASPEMFVRVEGTRVETCPISGTIARTGDVLADADRILELLNSEKDKSELTMCTDVDRNDKSRVCDPATIRIIGRRQIETYSRLFHTVDHVEGTLLPQFDALDAFLTHTWAVTVTGAPKLWAKRFIEEHEKSQRRWYGGAMGAFYFNGNINTGLTLRTMRVKDGIAEVRAGATLLIDSDPQAEERETRTKALALLDAIRRPDNLSGATTSEPAPFEGTHILLVDHEDSFVLTLAGYLRRSGATVSTVRVPKNGYLDVDVLDAAKPDLVVLSPGPGTPQDFHISETLRLTAERSLPVFGVCLGLQGIAEHFGGTLLNAKPMHGRASAITVKGGSLFDGLPETFVAGRYHSLCADVAQLPETLTATAFSDDGTVMAVEHASLPIAAVQFHPESMMTMQDNVGLRLIHNVLSTLLPNK